MLNSALIDIETFDVFPNYNERSDSWDFIGILASVPKMKHVCPGRVRWEFDLFQTENRYLNIEVDTYSQAEEPKFQRNSDPVGSIGSIVFIKHVTPYDVGRAGLFPPFGQIYQGRKHYNHRTILVIKTSAEDLLQFEKVRSLVFL